MTDPLIPRLRAKSEELKRRARQLRVSASGSEVESLIGQRAGAFDECAGELEALLSAHDAPQHHESRSPDGDGQAGMTSLSPALPQAGPQSLSALRDHEARMPAGSEPADSHSQPAREAATPAAQDVLRVLRLWLAECPTDKRLTLTRRQVEALTASAEAAQSTCPREIMRHADDSAAYLSVRCTCGKCPGVAREAATPAEARCSCGQYITVCLSCFLQAEDALKAEAATPAADEEMTPHPFNSRTQYEPGDDRDIWCKDCEYHRDHEIHRASAEVAPVERPAQEALRQIGIMAMLAQSDPHATAEAYRKSLIDICNYALKALPALPPSTERQP